MSETTTQTKETTIETKTFPIILERVVAGEYDETGKVTKLSEHVAPILTIQALMTTVTQLVKEKNTETVKTEEKKEE